MMLNFVVAFAVSRVTPPPPQDVQDMVRAIRVPGETQVRDIEATSEDTLAPASRS